MDEEGWIVFIEFLTGQSIRGLKRKYKHLSIEDILRGGIMTLQTKRDRKRVKKIDKEVPTK